MEPTLRSRSSQRHGPRGASGTVPSLEERLRETSRELFGPDARLVRLGGKLLRPRFALLGRSGDGSDPLEGNVLAAALATQLAHEASLLHDDVVDGAETRRNRKTRPAEDGVAAALIAGDRLLTLGYRAAASASASFSRQFSEAVDRTVAGEARQGLLRGQSLSLEEYRRVIADKSGALFGVALVGHALVSDAPADRVRATYDLGVRAGTLYQMVDDVLDYCPSMNRGKPALTDFRQEKWTLPLVAMDHPSPFEMDEEMILRRLHGAATAEEVAEGVRGGESPMERVLRYLDEEADGIVRWLEDQLDDPAPLVGEVRAWVRTARRGIEGEAVTLDVRLRARHVGKAHEWPAFFGRHSRSFHFAAHLFPTRLRGRISGIYAFCRFTDDLVDEADASTESRREELRGRLRAWRSLVERAHGGAATGITLLDEVVVPAGERGVPFDYLDALLKGVGMDVDPPEYPDLDALRVYTYRVASVVGGWITEEIGVRDPGVLDRAYALGHAMQMTNILRDVGEDLRAGRLYLPLDRMAAHGVRRGDLEAAARRLAPIPAGYAGLVEELMGYAEEEYRFARTGLLALPLRIRAAVAVAAEVYGGIHGEIRRRGYDSLTGRAFTSRVGKLRLGARALVRLPGVLRDRTSSAPGPSYSRTIPAPFGGSP